MINNIIVNPNDNKSLAIELWKLVKGFKTTYPMKRDYCGDINDELKEELKYCGIRAKRVYGLYKVDNIENWLDEEDFTEDELDLISNKFGNTYRDDLESYVKSLPLDKQKEYLYIPHVFLIVGNLILDAASDMFNDMISKQSKFRYFYENKKPVIEVG